MKMILYSVKKKEEEDDDPIFNVDTTNLLHVTKNEILRAMNIIKSITHTSHVH